MKGIILAGGAGTRLHPITQVVSKQLLPVYDKPMIFYPLSLLISAGINEILIITTPRDILVFQALLGDGSSLGIKFQYLVQDNPLGLAHAFILAEDFIAQDNVTMVLGDNIFLGLELKKYLSSFEGQGAYIFNSFVQNPERYGVVSLDENRNIISIIEKPERPPSNYAVTGLYHYDSSVVSLANDLKPSPRGELEITDLNNVYLEHSQLHGHFLDQDVTWFDTGTFSSLSDASKFVEAVQNRHGRLVGSPHMSAVQAGFISPSDLLNEVGSLKSQYFTMLQKALRELES